MSLAAAPLWFEKTARSGARRMGGLTNIMTLAAKAWAREFAKLASVPGEIAYKGAGTPTNESVLAKAGSAMVHATLETPWEAPLLIRFDKRFLVTMVEALFGSAGDEDLVETSSEPLSRIETGIADVIGGQVADALSEGFAETAANFTYGGLIPKVDPALLGKPQGSILVASFAINTIGRTVELDVLFPQAALDQLGEDLTSVFDLARSAPDPFWSERLESEVGRSHVKVRAVVETIAMTVAQVAALKPGQILELPPGAGGQVRLSCEDRDLFRCELGQSSGHYTVRITAPAASE